MFKDLGGWRHFLVEGSNPSYPNMLSTNGLRKIQGQLPMKRDVVDWGSAKILTLIQFADFFTEDGKFAITVANIEAARRRALEEDFWDEFIARIDVVPGQDGGTVRRFSIRFLSLVRVPLSWLKSNPHAVTPEMFELMEKNPRMQWASSAFKSVETDMGVQIVLRDQGEHTDPGINNPTHAGNVDTPAAKFEQAKLNLTSMLLELSKSIPRDDIKNMSAKDRIAAFDKLMNTGIKIMGGGRPSTVIFQKINVGKATKEELESSILSYGESQQIEE